MVLSYYDLLQKILSSFVILSCLCIHFCVLVFGRPCLCSVRGRVCVCARCEWSTLQPTTIPAHLLPIIHSTRQPPQRSRASWTPRSLVLYCTLYMVFFQLSETVWDVAQWTQGQSLVNITTEELWLLCYSDLYYSLTQKAQFKFKYTFSIHNVAFQQVLYPQKTEDQLDSTI